MCDSGSCAREHRTTGAADSIMRGKFIVVAMLLCACTGADKAGEHSAENDGRPVRPTASTTRAPTLRNRAEVLRYRDDAARLLLPPGDSLTVYVFARIDGQGITHQPEIKDTIADERIKGAAISVVQLMHFNPATADGQATSVLIRIPVRFVHPSEK